MDTPVQVISNIQVLRQLGLKPEELESIQQGTYEDIHHALFAIQKRLPDGVRLNIDNLTADAATLYNQGPHDGQEQFAAEQKSVELPNMAGFAGLAGTAVALQPTSKEHELATGYEVEKKDEVNGEIAKIKGLEGQDRHTQIRKVLDSLQREELHNQRLTDLKARLTEADQKKAADAIEKLDKRFSDLKKEREAPSRTKTATDEAYKAYTERLTTKLAGMSDTEVESYLKKYTSRQLGGTRIDYQRLFNEELEARKRFKFLGKYKRAKKIVSVRDQNRMWKKQKGNVKKIVKKWDKEKEKLRREAKMRQDKRNARLAARLSFLSRFLRLRRRRPQQATEEQYITTDDSSSGDENSDQSSSSNRSPQDLINKIQNTYNNAQDLANLAKNATKLLRGLGGEGGALSGLGGFFSGLGGFFATPPGWITAAILFLFLLLFILVMIFASINPNANATLPGQKLCPDATPTSAAQMVTLLEQQFNIHIHGSDATLINDLYTTSCTLSAYTFIQLMHIPSIRIDLYIDNPACSGHTEGESGGYRVDIHACASSAGDQFIITHEFAHVIQFENANLVGKFCSQAYHGSISKGHCESSSPNIIPTYNCLRDYTPTIDTPNPAECFSDMAGAFLTYKNFHDTITRNGQTVPNNWERMDNYPTNFPQYYNFASQNLFLPNTTIPTNASGLVTIAQTITSKLSKTFGRKIDLYDQIKPNPPGNFQLPNSPNPKYVVVMRGGQSCATINGNRECVLSRYWCTDLLIDTYNVVLGKRVLGEDLGTVEDMIIFWKNPPTTNFVFVHYRNANEHQNALAALYTTKPNFGDALFFESVEGKHTGFEHVALIRDVSLDGNGNGVIHTYEANNGSTTGTYPISRWQIKNTPYPVTGFGLYK